MAGSDVERDRYCRLAMMAGHCRMFCFSHPDLFENHLQLKPFKSHGILMAFYGYYYPSLYDELIDDQQRVFCRSLYRFKDSKRHGIEFFEACMAALQADGKPYHIMFMPCSHRIKYCRRFKRPDGYIRKHRPELTSGLCNVDVCKPRENQHAAKGSDNRILERIYHITGNIGEKRSSSWTTY